jgi:hypothetical protein
MGYLEIIKRIPGLVAYMPLDSAHGPKDIINNTTGIVHGNVRFAADGAHFDGASYIEFPDKPYFSPVGVGTKQFTVVVFQTVDDWTRVSHNNEYIHWMGKGRAGGHEWTFRIYKDGGGGEAASRRRRTSFYSYNPSGGLGTGSYFQDEGDGPGVERCIAGQISLEGSGATPGFTRMVKNGVQRDQDPESQYAVKPQHTNAPLGIGSRGDDTGFLVGRIRRVAFFNRVLTASELKTLYDARNQPETSGSTPPVTPPTVTTVPNVGVVTLNGKTHALNSVDKARGANELVAYTPKFGATTDTNEYGTEVTVVGGLITAVQKNRGNMSIPAGGVVVSGHGTAKEWLNENAATGRALTLPAGIAPAPPNPDIRILRDTATEVRAALSRVTDPASASALNSAAEMLESTADHLS